MLWLARASYCRSKQGSTYCGEQGRLPEGINHRVSLECGWPGILLNEYLQESAVQTYRGHKKREQTYRDHKGLLQTGANVSLHLGMAACTERVAYWPREPLNVHWGGPVATEGSPPFPLRLLALVFSFLLGRDAGDFPHPGVNNSRFPKQDIQRPRLKWSE